MSNIDQTNPLDPGPVVVSPPDPGQDDGGSSSGSTETVTTGIVDPENPIIEPKYGGDLSQAGGGDGVHAATGGLASAGITINLPFTSDQTPGLTLLKIPLLGDVKLPSLEDIWNNPAMAEQRTFLITAMFLAAGSALALIGLGGMVAAATQPAREALRDTAHEVAPAVGAAVGGPAGAAAAGLATARSRREATGHARGGIIAAHKKKKA